LAVIVRILIWQRWIEHHLVTVYHFPHLAAFDFGIKSGRQHVVSKKGEKKAASEEAALGESAGTIPG
jgi:hypothetical protein